MACEPAASYNRTSVEQPNAVSNPCSENMDDLISVEEYFGKLRTMVNEYYDNIHMVVADRILPSKTIAK